MGDLERLKLVLDHLPDERLMERLERHRGNGRDDYPIRTVWNSIIAGICRRRNPPSYAARRLISRVVSSDGLKYTTRELFRSLGPAYGNRSGCFSKALRSVSFHPGQTV